jgi:hypothetical protein
MCEKELYGVFPKILCQRALAIRNTETFFVYLPNIPLPVACCSHLALARAALRSAQGEEYPGAFRYCGGKQWDKKKQSDPGDFQKRYASIRSGDAALSCEARN